MNRIPILPEEAQAWTEAMALFDRWPELDEASRQLESAALERKSARALGMLKSLLAAEAEAEGKGFLEDRSAIESITLHPLADSTEAAAPPQSKVGHWTLDRQLGAGGMGRVWLAHRDDGMYEGSVAIKMLHESVDSAGARERFAREGRVLARLSHPNIARLLDAGFLPDGQRYLVIEYVAGERIDVYCEALKLGLRERVELFRQVCLAVAHAHANLVVHRDLKPANILVLPEGQVKLLDFGIAKLIERGDDESEETALTRVGGAMTPEYASPEQIDGGDITTASDIYALGVVLYRLLSGASPYVASSASPSRLARAIVDTDPRPLTAAFDARLAASVASPAASSGAHDWRRELAGDMQQIVAKAMRKLPEERYSSVQTLLEDLEAYLEFRPVSARPPAFSYLAGKFVRRHRVGVVLASLALLALMASLAGLAWETRIAMREEARAVEQAQRALEQRAIADREAARARAEAAHAAEEETRARSEEARAGAFRRSAEREAQRAKEQEVAAREQARKARVETAKAVALKDFMVDVFRVNTPAGGSLEKAQNTTAKELLESGAKRLSGRFGDQPELRSDMLDILGELFYRLGDLDSAERMARERVELFHKGEMPKDFGSEMSLRTNLISTLQGKGDTQAALKELDEQEVLLRSLGSRGEPWRQNVAMNRARAHLATDPAQSIAEAREAIRLATRDEHLHSHLGHMLPAWETLAQAEFQIENYASSLQAATEAHRLTVVAVGRGTAREVRSLTLLGQAQRGLRQRSEALASLKSAAEIGTRTLGANHPETLFARLLHAALRHEAGKPESLASMQASLQALEALRSPLSWPLLWSRLELAFAYYAEGRFSECEKLAERIAQQLRASGEYRPALARALTLQARLRALHGDTAGAAQLAGEAVELARTACGEKSPAYLAARAVPMRMALIEDRYAEFRYDPILQLMNGKASPPGPIASEMMELTQFNADYLLRRGEKYAALDLYAEQLDALEAEEEGVRDAYRHARLLLGLGRARFLVAEYEAAQDLLTRAVKLRQHLAPGESLWLAEARLALADCLIAQGKVTEAAALVAAAERAHGRNLPLGLEHSRSMARIKAKLVEAGAAG